MAHVYGGCHLRSTGEVVTAIEILSLANKLTQEGRAAYNTKRQRVLGSQTNLVEIDLLRAGTPLPVAPH